MTEKLRQRIINERIVDTKNYRYIIRDDANKATIERLPLDALDTPAAIDGWEVVEVLR